MNHKLKLTCAVLAAASLAWPVASASAQNPQGSVQDFRLEPGQPTPPPDVQGPVDADAPIRTPAPAPAPPTIAVPPPTAAPTIAVPAARPTAAPSLPRPAPAATDAPAGQQPAVVAGEGPAALPPPPAAFPDLTAPVPAIESPTPPAEAEQAPAEEGSSIPGWAWLAAAIAALLAGAAWFLLLRRRKPQAPVLLEPAPRPVPRPAPTPAPAPEAPAPAPIPAVPSARLSLLLTPRSLSASLFMATLQYRIELENTGPEPLGPIAIAGDMTAAHASRSPQDQLVAIGDDLGEMHRIEGLEPGQKTELTGNIRLPLSAITPIRRGSALFFVPLVRIYAKEAGADAVIGGGTFVIGEPPATPGGRLRPFRLDLGPRVYPTVEQRKLSVPGAMPLDGRVMAG